MIDLGSIYLTLIAASFGVFVVALALAIGRNVETGNRYRATLLRQLEPLNLARMLAFQGVDLHRYVHQIPITEILLRMRACKCCAQQQTCDDLIASERYAEATRFCVNTPSPCATKSATPDDSRC